MRGIPRARRFIVFQSHPVMMTHHRLARVAAAPVVARAVLVAVERRAIGLRTGQYVVHVGLVAATVYFVPFLCERGVLVDLVVRTVQVVDIARDDDALCILPRTFADAVARMDGELIAPIALAQVRAPRAEPCPRRRCQRLAVLVGSRKTAEIGAIAVADARHEKGHLGLLREHCTARESEQQGRRHAESAPHDCIASCGWDADGPGYAGTGRVHYKRARGTGYSSGGRKRSRFVPHLSKLSTRSGGLPISPSRLSAAMMSTNTSSAFSMGGMPKLTLVWKITSRISRGLAPFLNAPRM